MPQDVRFVAGSDKEFAKEFGTRLLIALLCSQHPVERHGTAPTSPVLGLGLADLVAYETVNGDQFLNAGGFPVNELTGLLGERIIRRIVRTNDSRRRKQQTGNETCQPSHATPSQLIL